MIWFLGFFFYVFGAGYYMSVNDYALCVVFSLMAIWAAMHTAKERL